MYDLIGDIHGHADELVQLLEAMDYRKHAEVYAHPERKVIFLGDFIDRGPKIREVLQIVRPMVEQGHALAVMGNHELNALAFHTKHPDNPQMYLRERSDKNIRQHCATMTQLDSKAIAEALAWFRTLPMWLDLDGVRAVHACWDEQAIGAVGQALQQHGGISTCFLVDANRKGSKLYRAVETILKGKEAKLPEGHSFTDKDGHIRTEIRVKWFESPANRRYCDYSLTDAISCQEELAPSVHAQAAPYPTNAKPVFVGHYWLSAKQPAAWTGNVACLDYSVAKKGFLCGYRWQGERKLRNEHFVRT